MMNVLEPNFCFVGMEMKICDCVCMYVCMFSQALYLSVRETN